MNEKRKERKKKIARDEKKKIRSEGTLRGLKLALRHPIEKKDRLWPMGKVKIKKTGQTFGKERFTYPWGTNRRGTREQRGKIREWKP